MPTAKKNERSKVKFVNPRPRWTAEEIRTILLHAHRTCSWEKYNNLFNQLSLNDMPSLICTLKDKRSESSINCCWNKIRLYNCYKGNLHLIDHGISDSLRVAIQEGLRMFRNSPLREEAVEKAHEVSLHKKTPMTEIPSGGTRFLVVSEGMGEEEYEVYANLSQVEDVLLDAAVDRVKAKDKSPLPKVYRCTEMEITVDMKVTIK